MHKYYHKLVDITDYYLDACVFSFSLPTQEMKYLKYKNVPSSYISNPLIFCRDWYRKLIIYLEKELSIISKSDHPNDWWFRDGIRFHNDKHHNLHIYLDGSFFIGQTMKSNTKQMFQFFIFINDQINKQFRNIREWDKIEFPRLKVSQLHISENLYHSKYKNGFKDKVILASKSVKNAMKIKNQPATTFEFLSDKDKYTPNLETGFSVGTTGSAICTVYNKETDPNKHHSIIRFGTDKFYRREFKLYRKKLRSTISHERYVEQVYSALNNTNKLKNIIKSCRTSVDIILKDDDALYTCFHDESIKNIKVIKKLISQGKKVFHRKIKYCQFNTKIAHKDIHKQLWNPSAMLKGTIESSHFDNMPIKEQLALLSMIAQRTALFVKEKPYYIDTIPIDIDNKFKYLQATIDEFVDNFQLQ